jgi:hypothetical protein
MASHPACPDLSPFQPPFSHLAEAVSRPHARLGEILAELARLDTLNRIAKEIAEELAVIRSTHKLSEFPAYKSARTSRRDEPLFARFSKSKRLAVEHKIFGLGVPLYRKTLTNGLAAIVVKYGNKERTLQIDSTQWITPIEALLEVKIGTTEEFKVKSAGHLVWDVRRHSRCAECGKQFTPQSFEFCGNTCKLAWLAKHKPACYTRPAEYPLSLLTFDGYVARAATCVSLRKFNKRDSAYGLRWEDRNVVDVNTIVNRDVKDPLKRISHESWWCDKCEKYCDQSWRWDEECCKHYLEHDCSATCDASPLFYYKTAERLHDARPYAADAEKQKAIRKIVREARLNDPLHHLDSVVKCELPLRQIGPTSQEQLERLFIHPEADFGTTRDAGDRGNRGFELIAEGSRQLTDSEDRRAFGSGGGRRVNTAGLIEDSEIDHEASSWRDSKTSSWGDGKTSPGLSWRGNVRNYGPRVKGDRCSRDYRADAIRQSRAVPRSNAVCAWPRCSLPFTQERKGHIYHTPHCCKMHHKETNGG